MQYLFFILCAVLPAYAVIENRTLEERFNEKVTEFEKKMFLNEEAERLNERITREQRVACEIAWIKEETNLKEEYISQLDTMLIALNRSCVNQQHQTIHPLIITHLYNKKNDKDDALMRAYYNYVQALNEMATRNNV